MAYASGLQKVDTYFHWYKHEVADMYYKLKKKEDFQYAMKELTNTLLPLECDQDFLKIHIDTAINYPPYCGSLVTHFKKLSRLKLSMILDQKKDNFDDDDVIVID